MTISDVSRENIRTPIVTGTRKVWWFAMLKAAASASSKAIMLNISMTATAAVFTVVRQDKPSRQPALPLYGTSALLLVVTPPEPVRE
ncbi:hypothetical protein AA23498_2964 [Acetobacter nitrogenifigens DSM 23921 = NBRC 105050]|uniref:Uncharacterized protein n=1 Tax=Acetobacter nitrogenifigens DSM 23921 = NBRC 105050 TaxID=1120919 RepID=A0A511XA48_9PROT|nr:hypothetical protein AA23498_2964 [Acetobacter nitrogenifigens DSM 23921 = NBRC 105050]GEN59830.1 hypothetical protein ANI02nite_17140 [Acetobacter nitrogenifigens DSM 23921 = NBRC 105050]